MSRTREQLERYLKTLDIKTGKILDVGGSQLPIRPRLKSCIAQEIKTYDLPVPHQTALRPDFVGDINVQHEIPYKADLIFCLEVFEYVYDPVTAIDNLAFWLNAGGKMIISFPFVYPLHNPPTLDYLRYTEMGACKLLENGGFKIDSVFYRTAEDGTLSGFYSYEGMKMARNYDHHNAVGFIITCTKK